MITFTLEEARRLTEVDLLIADAADQRLERAYFARVDCGELANHEELTTRRQRARFVAALKGDYAPAVLPVRRPKDVAMIEILRYLRPELTHEEAVELLGYDDAPGVAEPWTVQAERALLQRVQVVEPPERIWPWIRSREPLPEKPGRYHRVSGTTMYAEVAPGHERDTDLIIPVPDHDTEETTQP